MSECTQPDTCVHEWGGLRQHAAGTARGDLLVVWTDNDAPLP
jgi:hypothetical protein